MSTTISKNAQGASAKRNEPRDHITREGRNIFATMTVFAGIAAWVPLVVVAAFPLTVVSALLSFATALKRGSRHGVSATWVGLGLACVGLFIQVAIASMSAVIGWAFG